MEIINKIIEFIKKNWKSVIVLICFLLLIFNLKTCSSNRELKNQLKNEKYRQEQNFKAFNDTIEVYKNKNGQISYKQVIGNMSLDELEKYNPDLYKLIKAEGGKVKTIIKTIIEYRDTGSTKNILVKLDKDRYGLNFYYTSPDSVLVINGKSYFYVIADSNKLIIKEDITKFDEVKIKFSIVTGIKKENGYDKIFITPSTDKITITETRGTDVTDYIKNNQKKNKFSVNVSGGYGIIFGKGNQLYHGPGIQLGIGYNILSF
ncbi:hypothetical protein M0Q50_04040 [bacterium]|nr:hypothetical protein [bacterium]